MSTHDGGRVMTLLSGALLAGIAVIAMTLSGAAFAQDAGLVRVDQVVSTGVGEARVMAGIRGDRVMTSAEQMPFAMPSIGASAGRDNPQNASDE
jgi:hypothetical protein